MTIRPLRLEYVGRYKKNYRYATYETHDHRKCRIGGSGMIKATNTFWKKILSYPITALGYDFGFKAETEDLHNPKFDRIDVIKALDFWIEHWVYQNKKDYILEGTVNKDFELTVRELIETREAVLKMPADTEFVRQKIRSIAEIKEIKPKMVEFTENVLQDGNSSVSTVDQFCYVVRKMTYKEYMKRNPYNPTNLIGNIFIQNFRDDRTRFGFTEVVDSAMDNLVIELSRVGAETNTNDEPNFILRGRRHTDLFTEPERPPNIAAEVASRAQQEGGPDHLLHSNLHPGTPESFNLHRITTTGELNLRTSSTETLVFENMHLSSIDGFSFSADPNTSMTVPVNFISLDSIEITMNMFLTPIQQVHMFDGPLGTVHRIQITPGSQNPVEIDGTEYHVVDINISYNPRDRLPFIFRDLWVESVEATQNILRVDFASEHRQNISLTLQVNSTMRNEFLTEGGRSWSLEILGNNMVRIGNNEFTVREPINITIR